MFVDLKHVLNELCVLFFVNDHVLIIQNFSYIRAVFMASCKFIFVVI